MAYGDPTPLDIAEGLLDQATGTQDAGEAARLIAAAQTHALIAIAKELGDVRDAVQSVQSALTDQDNFGVGIHAHWINEWLKKIAESR